MRKNLKYSNIIYFYLVTVLVFGLYGSTQAAEEENIQVWSVNLIISELSGVQDGIRFGEASIAKDLSSPDSLDIPKPPPPITPYIYSFFTSDFVSPYNKLQQDFRNTNRTYAFWNFTIIWVPEDYISGTNITISWRYENLSKSPYTSIKLYLGLNSSFFIDMISNNSFTYRSDANIPQKFQIKCSIIDNNQNPVPFVSFSIFILSIFITVVLLIIKRSIC